MKDKAVIFDMDGVLVETEVPFVEECDAFFQSLGVRVTSEMKYSFIGMSDINVVKMVIKEFSLRQKPEDLFEKMEAHFEKHLTPRIHYPSVFDKNIIPFLKELKKRQYRTAIASSSPLFRIEEMITSCGVKEYFDFYVSGDQFKESKPHPEIYLHTATVLGLEPKSCVVIEDSVVGVEAAKKAGMKVIGVQHEEYHIFLPEADRIAAKTADIPLTWIEELLAEE